MTTAPKPAAPAAVRISGADFQAHLAKAVALETPNAGIGIIAFAKGNFPGSID
jgi:hypothetical protein